MQSAITNADITRYVKIGLPENVIINLIGEAQSAGRVQSDLTASALSDLADRGVSSAIITLMQTPPTPPVVDAAPSRPVAAERSPRSLNDVTKKTEEHREKANQDRASAAAANDAEAGAGNTFSPTADNIFVCKARSVKALFKAVDAEHHGHFTSQFANLKLRDNPALAAAAKTDAAGCEKGTYLGAMEQALKAEADESARLQGLLQRIK